MSFVLISLALQSLMVTGTSVSWVATKGKPVIAAVLIISNTSIVGAVEVADGAAGQFVRTRLPFVNDPGGAAIQAKPITIITSYGKLVTTCQCSVGTKAGAEVLGGNAAIAGGKSAIGGTEVLIKVHIDAIALADKAPVLLKIIALV